MMTILAIGLTACEGDPVTDYIPEEKPNPTPDEEQVVSCKITSPENGAEHTLGEPLTISCEGEINLGEWKKLSLKVGSEQIEITSLPFTTEYRFPETQQTGEVTIILSVIGDRWATASESVTISLKEPSENPDPTPEPTPDPTPENPNVADGLAYIFDMEALPEIHVTVSEEQWNELLTLYDRDANTDEYIHCDATFTKNGELHSFTDAGLRLRGNTSRRRPEGNGGEMHNTSNPDYRHVHFMLNLRKFQKDDAHKLGGVKKIHLKWHKDDPCYVREIFCYDLFRRYDIWTAINTSYCRLWLKVGDSKEAYYGVYIMLEAIDDDYVENREHLFGNSKGFLWKCGWSNSGFGANLRDTNDDRFWHDDNAGTENRAYCLKTEIDNFEAAKAQLKDFILKLNGKTGDSFKEWITKVCDVELLLKTYAVNVAVGMWDDYWCNQNNYYIYFNSQDLYDYKFFFIPYDYDNTLGTSSIIDAGRQNPLQWGNNDHKLISKLLEYEPWRKIYVDALKELCNSDELFSVEGSIMRVLKWQQMVGPYVDNDTGEDCSISDHPAGWGNHSEYRLTERGSNNFFEAKRGSIISL